MLRIEDSNPERTVKALQLLLEVLPMEKRGHAPSILADNLPITVSTDGPWFDTMGDEDIRKELPFTVSPTARLVALCLLGDADGARTSGLEIK